jgi:hypothetical protein
VYSGCFIFIIFTSVLCVFYCHCIFWSSYVYGCFICFDAVMVWVYILTHGFVICACLFNFVVLWVFWGGIFWVFSSWSYNFWFVGHQTKDKVQKYASANANTPSLETYISDFFTDNNIERCRVKTGNHSRAHFSNHNILEPDPRSNNLLLFSNISYNIIIKMETNVTEFVEKNR